MREIFRLPQNHSPVSTALWNILLYISITRINNNSDNGPLYLNLQELLEKPGAIPLARIKKCTQDMQEGIQLFHLSPKPISF